MKVKCPFNVGDRVKQTNTSCPDPDIAIVTGLTKNGFTYDYGRTKGGIPRAGICFGSTGEVYEAGFDTWVKASPHEIANGLDVFQGETITEATIWAEKYDRVRVLDREGKLLFEVTKAELAKRRT